MHVVFCVSYIIICVPLTITHAIPTAYNLRIICIHIQSKNLLAKDVRSHDHSMKDVLDFFGDGPSISSANDNQTSKTAAEKDSDRRRQRKRKQDVDISTTDTNSHSDSVDTELAESEISDISDADQSDISEREEEEEHEGEGGEGLQLFAGHTPLKWQNEKGGERKKKKRQRRKRKRLDKETKEILRRQEVGV